MSDDLEEIEGVARTGGNLRIQISKALNAGVERREGLSEIEDLEKIRDPGKIGDPERKEDPEKREEGDPPFVNFGLTDALWPTQGDVTLIS